MQKNIKFVYPHLNIIHTHTPMKEITVQELKQKLDKSEDFQLIDVREPFEYEICNLDGELIPMGIILSETEKISKDKTVIIHCKSGGRSGAIVNELEKIGFTNLYNLKGGILAYAREIDPSLTTY
jgi:rhodanese-related sulfurtransferase